MFLNVRHILLKLASRAQSTGKHHLPGALGRGGNAKSQAAVHFAVYLLLNVG